MFFTICLYIAVAIFIFGLFAKVYAWFRFSIDPETRDISFAARVFAAIKGIAFTVFSEKIFILLKVLVFDIVLQIKVYRESVLRWIMHMCLFVGFMILLLMHALDRFITSTLFVDYYPTLNPYLFIRNLSAALVIIGLLLAVYRRFILKVPRLKTNTKDYFALIILAVIMISGIFLEGTKIVSYTSYQRMVEDYSDLDDDQEYRALGSYWVKEFGVVSPDLKEPFDKNILALGKELHQVSCIDCHSYPQWGFISHGVSKLIKPIALGLDRLNLPIILWYIHFLACFIGLAYLPFGKMFHIITGPLCLLANAVMDREKSDPANIATRQVLELDACTSCGNCSLRCAVGVSFEEIPNVYILPSEKIAALKSLAYGKKLNGQESRAIQEGLYLCTNCYRCTEACPVGINLQDLWFNARENILQKGYPEFLILSPFSFFRGIKQIELGNGNYERPLKLAKDTVSGEFNLAHIQDGFITPELMDWKFKREVATSIQGNTYSYCFTCKTCSNACPVVLNFANPGKALGLLPHQVIHATKLGITDLVLGSKMLWSCLGCYECQEHCPLGVQIADIFYELKNLAVRRLKEKASKLQGEGL